MTRRAPQEDAVREQLRSRADDGNDGEAAAAEAAGNDGGREAPAGESEELQGEGQLGAEQGDGKAAPPAPDPLTKAQAERDEYLELARRTQADFENYRKRVARDVAAAGERAKVGLVRDLLPVLDNLERALAAENGDGAGLAEGVRLVLADLQGVLAREGVEALAPVGEQFDPTVHEALSTRAEDGAAAGVVLDVVEKGYRMNDTVIRPARVVVSA